MHVINADCVTVGGFDWELPASTSGIINSLTREERNAVLEQIKAHVTGYLQMLIIAVHQNRCTEDAFEECAAAATPLL